MLGSVNTAAFKLFRTVLVGFTRILFAFVRRKQRHEGFSYTGANLAGKFGYFISFRGVSVLEAVHNGRLVINHSIVIRMYL